MLIQSRTTQFKRDVKLCEKRGRDLSKLKKVILKLINEEPLDPKFRDHKLSQNYKDHRECHIEPDWLLIYRVDDKEILFVRTGTHSDLFKM
ncbi:MAG: type II toxin-antitoxin system YafQ family toxin [Verrucomicrobia bacterium]|nr:type II toxin-antitoxin system YafQ family toxin [Verrucomicrobiota bacterium]MDE3047915.1 type II toxin-antitoxin system YafQ family toxin [Verrucomicrobiota bacterium]